MSNNNVLITKKTNGGSVVAGLESEEALNTVFAKLSESDLESVSALTRNVIAEFDGKFNVTKPDVDKLGITLANQLMDSFPEWDSESLHMVGSVLFSICYTRLKK